MAQKLDILLFTLQLDLAIFAVALVVFCVYWRHFRQDDQKRIFMENPLQEVDPPRVVLWQCFKASTKLSWLCKKRSSPHQKPPRYVRSHTAISPQAFDGILIDSALPDPSTSTPKCKYIFSSRFFRNLASVITTVYGVHDSTFPFTDSQIYLMFLKQGQNLSFYLAVIGVLVMIPINISSPAQITKDMSWLESISAIDLTSDGWQIWAVAAATLVYCSLSYYSIYELHRMSHVIKSHQQKRGLNQELYTIMLENLDPHLTDPKQLENHFNCYFRNQVLQVHIVCDYACYQRRLRQLEKATNKYKELYSLAMKAARHENTFHAKKPEPIDLPLVENRSQFVFNQATSSYRLVSVPSVPQSQEFPPRMITSLVPVPPAPLSSAEKAPARHSSGPYSDTGEKRRATLERNSSLATFTASKDLTPCRRRSFTEKMDTSHFSPVLTRTFTTISQLPKQNCVTAFLQRKIHFCRKEIRNNLKRKDIAYWADEVTRCENKLNDMALKNDFKSLGLAFVSFRSQACVVKALEDPRIAHYQHYVNMKRAPNSKNIIWENLSVTHTRRVCQGVASFSLVLVAAAVFTSSAIIGALIAPLSAQIEAASRTLKLSISEYVGPLMITFVNAIVIPQFVQCAANYIKFWEISARESAILHANIIFMFLNTVIFPIVGSGSLVTAFLVLYNTTMENGYKEIGTQVFQESSSLAIRYVLNSCFLTSSLQLLQVSSTLYTIVTTSLRKVVSEPCVFDFGYHYAFCITVYSVTLIYGIPFPIILPCSWIFFHLKYFIDKYAFAYGVFIIDQETRGSNIATVIRYCLFTTAVTQFVMFSFFMGHGINRLELAKRRNAGYHSVQGLFLMGTLLLTFSFVTVVLLAVSNASRDHDRLQVSQKNKTDSLGVLTSLEEELRVAAAYRPPILSELNQRRFRLFVEQNTI